MSAAAHLRDAFLRGLPPIPSLYPGAAPDATPNAHSRPAPLLPATTLADYLERYYWRLFPASGPQPAVAASIAKLRQPGAVTVTTGQQPALFGGPLYNVYKAIGAIAHAQRIERQQSNASAVPVFWLAGEDHDADELNHTYTAFDQRLTYDGPFAGSVGRHIINHSIHAVGGPAHPLRRHFAPGVPFADAFARTIDDVLGHLGLVILDPDAPELKAAFAPIVARELTERPTYAAVSRRSEVLLAADLPVQLHARPINLFYLTATARERIAVHGDDFRLVGSERIVPRAALLTEAQTHPERFSPNAALRPVYQEAILPNVCYVGGWGELAYWLQLGDVFESFGVAYPQLRPRPAALFLHAEQHAAIHASGLTLTQLLQPDDTLRKLLADRLWPADSHTAFTAFEAEFEALYERLAAHLGSYAPELTRPALGQAARNRRFLAELPRKIRRQLLAQNPAAHQPLLALKDSIQPDGAVQERTLGLIALPLDALRNLAEALLAAEAHAPNLFATQTYVLPANGPAERL